MVLAAVGIALALGGVGAAYISHDATQRELDRQERAQEAALAAHAAELEQQTRLAEIEAAKEAQRAEAERAAEAQKQADEAQKLADAGIRLQDSMKRFAREHHDDHKFDGSIYDWALIDYIVTSEPRETREYGAQYTVSIQTRSRVTGFSLFGQGEQKGLPTAVFDLYFASDGSLKHYDSGLWTN